MLRKVSHRELVCKSISKIINPIKSDYGVIQEILSCPDATVDEVAMLVTEVYSGLNHEALKKRFYDAIRKDIDEELRRLSSNISYKRGLDWSSQTKYKWLAPGVTIGKVRGESRFSVKRVPI